MRKIVKSYCVLQDDTRESNLSHTLLFPHKILDSMSVFLTLPSVILSILYFIKSPLSLSPLCTHFVYFSLDKCQSRRFLHPCQLTFTLPLLLLSLPLPLPLPLPVHFALLTHSTSSTRSHLTSGAFRGALHLMAFLFVTFVDFVSSLLPLLTRKDDSSRQLNESEKYHVHIS